MLPVPISDSLLTEYIMTFELLCEEPLLLLRMSSLLLPHEVTWEENVKLVTGRVGTNTHCSVSAAQPL